MTVPMVVFVLDMNICGKILTMKPTPKKLDASKTNQEFLTLSRAAILRRESHVE
jgi:hypothetical protein